MEDKIKKFEFDEKNHIYKLYGLTIQSVSEIIEPIHKKIYENISYHSLEIAADRETRAHRAIEFWNKYDFYNVDNDCKGYIEAYIKFRDEHPSWKVLNSEIRTYHKNLLYGMTIDEVYQTPKGIVINDIKTTSQAHLDAWAVQLGGYRSGYESQHSSISGTTILQLFKDGRYIRSGETFKDESSQHYRMYIEGYNFMLKQIKEDRSKIFEKMFKEKLKQVRKV